jgi:hypothetical protein
MSQEVKPTVSVALCNEIERAFGKVMGTQGYIAPSMKIGLADIVQRMAPTRT